MKMNIRRFICMALALLLLAGAVEPGILAFNESDADAFFAHAASAEELPPQTDSDGAEAEASDLPAPASDPLPDPETSESDAETAAPDAEPLPDAEDSIPDAEPLPDAEDSTPDAEPLPDAEDSIPDAEPLPDAEDSAPDAKEAQLTPGYAHIAGGTSVRVAADPDASDLAALSACIVYISEIDAEKEVARIHFAQGEFAFIAWADTDDLTPLTAEELDALRIPGDAPAYGGHALPEADVRFLLHLIPEPVPELLPDTQHALRASFSDGRSYPIQWRSDNPGVAEVSADGKLTARAPGSAVLTAESLCEAAELHVTVSEPESISLNTDSLTIGAGETLSGALYCSVTPASLTGELRWKSSNTRYVKVNATTGAITGVRAGSANVIVSTPSGMSASCKVTVRSAPRSIALKAPAKTLGAGESVPLSVSFNSGAYSHSLRYTISDSSILRIEENTLHAIVPGTATISVKTFNNKSAKLEITVKAAPEQLTLSSTVLTIGAEDSAKLGYTLNGGAAGAVSFSSSDETVATVDADGTIHALTQGSAVITATTYNGVSAECALSVSPAPTGVTLSAERTTIGVGEKMQLTARLEPAGTTGTLKFSSSNTRYATVDASGVVTGKKAGTVTITATTYNGKKGTLKITVKKAPTSVNLKTSRSVLGVGETAQLTATLPSGTAGAFSFSSAGEAIATVDENGLVTALQPGAVTVTVKTFNGKTKSGVITVKPAPEAITLSQTALTIGAEDSVKLGYTLNGGAAGAVSFSSSDEAVATMDADGTIHALKEGSTTITATSYNGVSAQCALSVSPAPTGVTLSAERTTIGVGEKIKLNAQMVPAEVSGTLKFSSSNTRYATVSADGVVTGKKAGSATITVTSYNGKKNTLKITVKKAPTSVSLKTSRSVLGVGETAQLTATLPSGTAGAYSFSSAGEAIATVDENGLVTALQPGAVTVSVKTFNGKTKSGVITVKPAPEAITLSQTALTISAEDSAKLGYTLNEGAAGAVSFSSSDEVVATVDADGTIHALTQGSAVITATTYNGVSAQCALSVSPAPTEMTLSQTTIYLGLGEVLSDALQVRLNEGSAASLRYKSSNTRYVKVDASGKLTGAKIGSATVTVSTHNGLTASCKVIVQSAPSKITLRLPASACSVGQTMTASVSVTGRGHWSLTSSKPEVVAVEEGCLLRALQEGEVSITAKTYNGKTSTVKLRVCPAPVEAHPVVAEASVGEGMQLQTEFAVNEGSFTTFRYAVADPELAQVDENGCVTGLKRGHTQLIATTHNALTATMELEILPAPDRIVPDEAKMTIGLGEIHTLGFTVEPENAVGTYSYASADAKLVSVDASGNIAGLALGTTQIRITAQNGTSTVIDVTVVPYCERNPVYCMAHRGASGYRPDNSIAAFEYAAQLGADMVELDVRKTKDGVLVVHHDASLSYKGKKYNIADITMANVRTANPNACTLEEALRCIAKTDMEVMIEFKIAGIEKAVMQCANACGLNGRALYGSFTLSVIEKIKSLDSSARTVYIMNKSDVLNKVTKNPEQYSADVISVSSAILTPTHILQLHLGGKQVVAWTINTRSEINRFIAMGVDGITTNYPDYM